MFLVFSTHFFSTIFYPFSNLALDKYLCLRDQIFSRVDKERIPIYLETETEENVKIYSKYGFNTLKDWDVPGAGFHF